MASGPHPDFELRARGLTFTARATGPRDGRPVVLLNGFPQTSWSWHRQLEALGVAGMRALAFDQRGYSPGARPAGIPDYRIDELVADVLAVADGQGFARFDVVGHDWGAAVAWTVAARHPERVRSLTAVSVPHPGAFATALGRGDEDQARRSSYIEVFRRDGGVAESALLGADGSGDGLRAMFAASGLPPDREEVEVFVAAMRQPGALTAALNWYRAAGGDTFAAVPPVTVPTLFVWSTEDVAIGRAAADACGRWVTAPYRFEVLHGVSHWIPETTPAELNRMLLEHLADT